MAESENLTTLFCQKCDYNLTGLATQRCPECGTEFEPQKLRDHAAKALKPINFHAAIFHLTWPPILFALLIILLAMTDLEWHFGMLFLCAIIYSFVNGTEMGIRTAATFSIRAGGSPYSRGPKSRLYCMILFFVSLQIVLVLVGAYGALRLVSPLM